VSHYEIQILSSRKVVHFKRRKRRGGVSGDHTFNLLYSVPGNFTSVMFNKNASTLPAV